MTLKQLIGAAMLAGPVAGLLAALYIDGGWPALMLFLSAVIVVAWLVIALLMLVDV